MSPLGVQFGASSRSKIGGAYFSDVTGSIKDMIECPNNWGVGSVFPTLENTYFLQKCCHQPDPMNIRSFQYYAADNEYGQYCHDPHGYVEAEVCKV